MCLISGIVICIEFINQIRLRVDIHPLKIYVESVVTAYRSVLKFSTRLTLVTILGYWISITIRIASWIEASVFFCCCYGML